MEILALFNSFYSPLLFAIVIAVILIMIVFNRQNIVWFLIPLIVVIGLLGVNDRYYSQFSPVDMNPNDTIVYQYNHHKILTQEKKILLWLNRLDDGTNFLYLIGDDYNSRTLVNQLSKDKNNNVLKPFRLKQPEKRNYSDPSLGIYGIEYVVKKTDAGKKTIDNPIDK